MLRLARAVPPGTTTSGTTAPASRTAWPASASRPPRAIAAVAVAYEEYRRTHTTPDAAVMVRIGATTAFDPAVVAAFVAALPDVERLYAETPDDLLHPDPPPVPLAPC